MAELSNPKQSEAPKHDQLITIILVLTYVILMWALQIPTYKYGCQIGLGNFVLSSRKRQTTQLLISSFKIGVDSVAKHTRLAQSECQSLSLGVPSHRSSQLCSLYYQTRNGAWLYYGHTVDNMLILIHVYLVYVLD